MQFLATLFGGNESSLLNAAFALGMVLALVLLALWAVKFVLGVSNGAKLGRGRRLALVETMQIDARHKVSIIRRDDTEYVVMLGGNQNVLLEAGIPVDRNAPRRPVARPAPGDRPATLPQTGDKPSDQGQTASAPVSTVPPRRPPPPRAMGLLRTAGPRRSHVIPIQTQNDAAGRDDSATSDPETPNDGQAKLGAATTSRFPGSTFNFEGR
jgi:flagellar biogenesis protein FliO